MKWHFGTGWERLAVMAVLMLCGAIQAGDPAATPAAAKPGPAIDPKAEQLIRQMSDYLGGCKNMRLDLTSVTKMRGEGMYQEFVSKFTVAIQRPDKLAMILKSGMMGATVVSDGKNSTIYFPMMRRYMIKPAPDKIEALSQELLMAGGNGFGFPMLAALISDKPFDSIMAGVKTGQLVGEETLDGVKCQHAKFTQDEFDWEIWIQAGPKPLLRKIVPDYTRAFAKMVEGTGEQTPLLKGMTASMTVSMDNWTVDAALPAELFAFVPPAGTQKVDSLLPGKDDPPGADGDAPSPLIGKPAPTFKIPQFDGGEFDLSAFRDKNVVILDFWATWCGPCRQAMPQLLEVAAAYKDKGVIFCAMNEDEDKDTIQKFLTAQKLQPQVALDAGGKVGTLYGVDAIPQTVIVGKDGIVKVVHIGLLPNLKQQLRQDLDAILAGNNSSGKPAAPPTPDTEVQSLPGK